MISPESSPELLPTSPGSSRLINELRIYSRLINKLLRNVEAAERHMEPLLGARMRDDIIVTHRREALRLNSMHGRNRLRATMTGNAWDLLESAVTAESSLSWPKSYQVKASNTSLMLLFSLCQVSFLITVLGLGTRCFPSRKIRLYADSSNYTIKSQKDIPRYNLIPSWG